MCDCLEKATELFKKRLDDPLAYVETTLTVFPEGSYPHFCVKYRKRKPNGEFTKSTYEKAIIPSHCPFCGKPYEEDPE